MPLGEKPLEILHIDESLTTGQDVTRNTPGSFPSDDRSRLTKSNDPQGFSGDTTSRDQTSGHVQTASRDATQQQLNERSNDRSDRTTEGFSTRPLEGVPRSGEETNVTFPEQVGGVASTQEHPHSNLPTGGVHNGVVGHGSAEDDERRRRSHQSGEYHPEGSTLASQQGTGLGQQSSGLGDDRQHLSDTSNRTTTRGNDAFGSQQQFMSQNDPSTQRSENQGTSGSRFNEGLAGAGLAGAGAGAYAHSKHRDDKTNEPTTRHDDEHNKRSLPILGRDHKDTHKEEKHGQEKHHGSSTAPLAGAGTYAATKDSDRHHHTSDTTRGDQYGQQSSIGSQGYSTTGGRDLGQSDQDRSRGYGGLATGAAAGLGAGALASHARSGNDKHSEYSGAQSGTGHHSGSGFNPSGTQTGHSDNPSSQVVESDRGFGHSKLTGVDAGAGALGSSGHHSGSDQYNAGQSGQYSSQSRTGGYGDSQSGQYGNTSTSTGHPVSQANTDYESQSNHPTQSQQEGHGYGGLAAGTAAGLGAGALASHAGQHRESQHPEQSQYSQSSDTYSSKDFQSQSSRPAGYGDSTSQYQQQTSSGHSAIPGVAASGFGAGAFSHDTGRGKDMEQGAGSGLGGSNLSQGDRGTSQHGLGNKEYTEGDRYTGGQSDRSGHGGLATGAAAGLGAGALASQAGQRHEGQYEGQHQGQHQGQHSDLSPGRNFTQGAQSDRYSSDPSGQSYQQSSDKSANLTGGVGQGITGSSLESSRHGDDQYSGDSSRGYQTGTGSGNTATPRYGNDNESSSRQKNTTQTGEGEEPSLTQHANQGQYDTLASGTPSGVRR